MATNLKTKVEAYYRLTKPGIIRGNIITALAGYFFAASGHVYMRPLIGLVAGLSLVIASGCVFNNYIDRNLDKKMKRTERRALVTGKISAKQAIIFGAILGIAGAIILAVCTSRLALASALCGWFAYVIVYGYAKRTTTLSTIIGSISGALPPVVGYATVTNTIDTSAWLLFFVLVFWQMPHFYAIALRRKADYTAAGLPVLPVVKNFNRVRRAIALYILAFGLACILLSSSLFYAAIMALVSIRWLMLALSDPVKGDETAWGKRVFLFSLLALLVWSVTISISWLLP